MSTFTSYERVNVVLEHQEAERVSFDLGIATLKGINIKSITFVVKILRTTGSSYY